MMEFRQLKYFVAVAEAGSFSKAAVTCGVAQPALSRQIKLLEEQLRAALFYRTGRGADLTPAGELLFAYASQALKDNARVMRQLQSLSGSLQGSVTLGILPSLSTLLTKPVLTRLRERHPDLHLHIREGMSGTLLDWLQNKKVDIATIYEPMSRSWFISDYLLADDLYFVRLAGDPRPMPHSIEDLHDTALALPGKQHGIRKLIEERLAECRGALNIIYDIDSIPMLKDMLREEKIGTILPRGAVHQEVLSGEFEIAVLEKPNLRRTLALTTASASAVDTNTRMVIQVIKQTVAEVGGAYGWHVPKVPVPALNSAADAAL